MVVLARLAKVAGKKVLGYQGRMYAPISKGTRMPEDAVSHARDPSLIHPFTNRFSLAWAEMYLLLSTLVRLFNFKIEGATAEDFNLKRTTLMFASCFVSGPFWVVLGW